MKTVFWKLSQGYNLFSYQDFLKSLEDKLVYVSKDTKAKGQSTTTQGQDFIDAAIGDYFYLTYGNNGIYLLGQFTGPANIFSAHGDGWLDRPYRIISRSTIHSPYEDIEKWWTPNHNSTFVKVPEHEIVEFEKLILKPYFEIELKDYGLKIPRLT